jgi:hypothetical protein
LIVKLIGSEDNLDKIFVDRIIFWSSDRIFQRANFFVMKIEVLDGIGGELKEPQIGKAEKLTN